MTPPKGKSRLKKSGRGKAGRRDRSDRHATPSPPRSKRYLRHLPLLFLGVLFYSLTGFILGDVQPAAIRDFLVPTAYLPLLGVVFLGAFFSAAFALLHTRRGLLVALGVTTLLFLKLQAVVLTAEVFAVIAIVLAVVEITAVILCKLRSR